MLKYLTAILLLCFTMHLSAQGSENVALYYSESCGHCIKVTNYLKQNPYPVTMKNIKDPKNRSELQGLGYRGVPVLVAGNERITGADQIIAYFRSHSK